MLQLIHHGGITEMLDGTVATDGIHRLAFEIANGCAKFATLLNEILLSLEGSRVPGVNGTVLTARD